VTQGDPHDTPCVYTLAPRFCLRLLPEGRRKLRLHGLALAWHPAVAREAPRGTPKPIGHLPKGAPGPPSRRGSEHLAAPTPGGSPGRSQRGSLRTAVPRTPRSRPLGKSSAAEACDPSWASEPNAEKWNCPWRRDPPRLLRMQPEAYPNTPVRSKHFECLGTPLLPCPRNALTPFK